MTLDDLKKSCEVEASLLVVNGKTYDQLTKNELGNGFCDWDEISSTTKDEDERERAEIMKSRYWAAIMLRYWYKIPKWILESKSLNLPPIEFYNWLHGSLHDAFYYRSWRKLRRARPNDPESEWIDNPQYTDMDNCVFDRSVNFFCAARRGKEYQAANKDKRKANTQAMSIDKTFDEDGYSILDREGLSTEGSGYNGIRSLINLFLEEDKLVEAVIIDSIAYGDSLKEDKNKYIYTYMDKNEKGEDVEVSETNYRYAHEFNARKVVKQLTELNDKYFTEYFTKEYNVKDYHPILEKIKSLDNNKLYKAIEKTLMSIQQSPELLKFVK